MKLAQSWTEDAPSLVTAAAFHDEVEEVDEVDEAKDGCAGVCGQKYVLRKPHTSNILLFELAREIRGVEKRHGRKLNPVEYISVYDKWKEASRPFLRPGNDYFTELLAKLDCVTVPKGETLVAAFERAKTKSPPEKTMISRNKDLRLLASLCRELQELAGDQPIMLCQVSVAKLFEHSSHRNISNWIKALKTLGVLTVAASWRLGKAARYFYIP